jgi:hypothetical protein
MKAANGYNRDKPTRSDTSSRIKNQENYREPVRGTKTSHDSESPSSFRCAPCPDQNHDGFQFGANPMNEDSFEKKMIMKEKMDRDIAREKYVMGIQGRDGGKKPYETHNIPN